MKKFFCCIILFFLTSRSYANMNSCHCAFLSLSKTMNITNVNSDSLKFLTDNGSFNTGFDVAYAYRFYENLYIGFGCGYWTSSSSIFKIEKGQKLHSGFVLNGKYIKFPLSLRFYFHDFLNLIKIYFYGDLQSLCNVSVDESENNFSDMILKGKKVSFGTTLGGGINLEITTGINLFVECLFAFRNFSSPIEIKFCDTISDFKISSLILNLGIHLDFYGNDTIRLD